MNNICRRCGAVHPSDAVAAVGRFRAARPTGYRANHPDAPLRTSRDAAMADWCHWRRGYGEGRGSAAITLTEYWITEATVAGGYCGADVGTLVLESSSGEWLATVAGRADPITPGQAEQLVVAALDGPLGPHAADPQPAGRVIDVIPADPDARQGDYTLSVSWDVRVTDNLSEAAHRIAEASNLGYNSTGGTARLYFNTEGQVVAAYLVDQWRPRPNPEPAHAVSTLCGPGCLVTPREAQRLLDDVEVMNSTRCVEMYETDASVILTRDSSSFRVGTHPADGSAIGDAVTDARAWLAGDWDPADDLEPTVLDGRERHVATITADRVEVHTAPGHLGGNYLGGPADAGQLTTWCSSFHDVTDQLGEAGHR